jgi:hypothetical protein
MIIYKIQEFWHEHGFNILVVLSIVFLVVLWLFQQKGSGTYAVTPPSFASISPRRPVAQTQSGPQPFTDNAKDSKLEQACRRALYETFGRPFNKARPEFLRNPVTKNFNLELDCYDPQLRLAVEAQGIQHYKYVPYFHKSKEAFQNQQYRDELKRRMCSDNKVNLIEVPYTVKPEHVKVYLVQKIRALGYKV